MNATTQERASEPTTPTAMAESVVKIDDGTRLRLLADNLPALIAYFRTDELICDFCNVAYASAYSLTPETAIGKTVPEIIGVEAYAVIHPYIQRVKRGERLTYQRPLVTPDGRQRVIEVTLIPHSADGLPKNQPNAAFVLINDVTKFKEAETAILESEERLQKFADATTEAIVFHENGIVTDVNDACARLVGYAEPAIIGCPVLDFVAPDSRALVLNHIRARYEEAYEGSILRADGTTLPVEFIGKEFAYQGKTQRMTVVRDLSSRKLSEARIHFLAHHDPLTLLPNRALLMDRLNVMLTAAQRQNKMLAVLFIDLDNLKTVNDSLGHHAGDALLKHVASQLQAGLRASDLVGRLSGDEFLIAITNLNTAEDAVPIVEKISAMIAEPFTVDHQMLTPSASIGVSLFPLDGREPDALIGNADAAMYAAKESGKNNIQYFKPALMQSAFHALAMETGMRRAIKNVEFILYYQPEVDVRTGKIETLEALIRWHHPEYGILTPDQFISIAEHRGLIMSIGRWVVEEAVAQAKRWRKQGINSRVAINFSPLQFKQKDLVEHLEQQLKAHQIPGSAIEVEITESVFLEDVATSTKLLKSLKELGVTITLDDFGTGYSSLAFLKRYPIDKIKIDRTFIRDTPQNADDLAITQAIISLAKSLGLALVAEGVETAVQQSLLQTNGCHHMQGFFISPPMTADETTAFALQKLQ
jgi:diguanylate cyclase (GGDEF)-like protein/PAS domain S-box-containing protein